MEKDRNAAPKDETVSEEAVIENGKANTDSTVEPNSGESDEINALREEVEKQKDLLLRTAAEYENFRKRTKREKEQFFTQAKSSVLSPLLPVFDSLERAIETESSNLEDYKKGVELVGVQLMEALKKLGVEKLGEVGEKFDPEKHNAVSREENPDAEENTIAQVMQKGYSVDGKIIRHAIVSVY